MSGKNWPVEILPMYANMYSTSKATFIVEREGPGRLECPILKGADPSIFGKKIPKMFQYLRLLLIAASRFSCFGGKH